MEIIINVYAKTTKGKHRQIRISADGSSVTCNCGGFHDGFCSHIDAVLVAQERAMVPRDQWELADKASKLVSAKIKAPVNWKASWRENLYWRGLAEENSKKTYNRRLKDNKKPLVCFTGTLSKTRKAMQKEAKMNGWEISEFASSKVDVYVASNPEEFSNKLDVARKYNIPIVTETEWDHVMATGELPQRDKNK